MKKLSDIVELADFFFKQMLEFDAILLQWNKSGEQMAREALMLAKKILSDIKKWELKELETELFSASEKFNSEKGFPVNNKGYLLWPLRVALSGKQMSPSPFEIALILGKEKTLKRIDEAILKI